MLRKRTTPNLLAACAMATVVATACTAATNPLAVAPSAPLAAKNKVVFT